MGRAVRALACLLLPALTPATIAHAADPIPASSPAPNWTVELGVEIRSLPHYPGSKVYGEYPMPLFDVRSAGTPPKFHGPRDGFGYSLLDTDTWKAGPVVQIELGRRVSHNPALEGLGNVGVTAEVGGFVDYWPTHWLRARVELRQGFGGHTGVVSDQTLDLVLPVSPQWTLSGGPRLTEATPDANAPYFSVSTAQGAASGLPVYDAGGGVRSYGLGTQARYQWNPQWASHAFVEYSRLTGDVGHSPIVAQRGSPDQVMLGVGVTYSFDTPSPW
jgi:MipA family protein